MLWSCLTGLPALTGDEGLGRVQTIHLEASHEVDLWLLLGWGPLSESVIHSGHLFCGTLPISVTN